MTIDKSLKVKAGGIQNRNVLTRAERIVKLKETERWKEGRPRPGPAQGARAQAGHEEKEEGQGRGRGRRGCAAAGGAGSRRCQACRRREARCWCQAGREEVDAWMLASPSCARPLRLPPCLRCGLRPCASNSNTAARDWKSNCPTSGSSARCAYKDAAAAARPARLAAGSADAAQRHAAAGRARQGPQGRLHRHLRHHAARAQRDDPAAGAGDARSGRHSAREDHDPDRHRPAPAERRRRAGRDGRRARSPTTTASRTITARISTSTRILGDSPRGVPIWIDSRYVEGRSEDHHRPDRAAPDGRLLRRPQADLPRHRRPGNGQGLARARVPRTSQGRLRHPRRQPGPRGEHLDRPAHRLRLHRQRRDRRRAPAAEVRGRRHGSGVSRRRRVRPRGRPRHGRRAGRYRRHQLAPAIRSTRRSIRRSKG